MMMEDTMTITNVEPQMSSELVEEKSKKSESVVEVDIEKDANDDIDIDDDSITTENSIPTLTFCPQMMQYDDDADGANTTTSKDVPLTGPIALGREIEPEIIVDLEYQAPQYPQSRPAFISVTVTKTTEEERLGIALREVNGELEIFSISDDGLLSASPLQPGDKLMSINNFRCSTWDPHKAIQKLKDSIGSLTLIAQHHQGDPNLVAAMVVKPKEDSKVGIGFGKIDRFLAVGSINPEGYFANSVLNIGDRIVSINGSPCGRLEPEYAVTVVRSSPSHVTFVALRQYMTGVVVSRHSFRSTCSSARSFYPGLVSAMDHGSNRSFAMYMVLIVLAFCATAFFAIHLLEQTEKAKF